MTLIEFCDRFLRVTKRGGGGTERLRLHARQEQLFRAIDEPGDDGLRRYREFLISYIRKAGKTTSLAAIGLYGLIADDANGDDREVIIASSDLAQSKDNAFTAIEKMIRRNPWLSQHCDVKGTEIHYTEQKRDDKTGGLYKSKHLIRAVPRDPKGLHGGAQSVVIIDEYWTQDSADLVEALSTSPYRPCPFTVYASYQGLKSQQRPGNPLWDLMQRALAGDDPQLYLSHLAGADAWREIPWITDAWVQEQRRKLPPARYRRTVENLPAGPDNLFLDADAIADAVKAHPLTDAEPQPGVNYVAAVDLGLSKDWAACVVAYVDGLTRLVPAAVRFWRPEKGKRLSLVKVEEEITALMKRYRVRRMKLDQWQAVAFAERLKLAGVEDVELVTLGQTQLDKLAGLLKGAFKDRLITIPKDPPELVEQLESLGEEEMKARNSKRDLVRFQSGTGSGAAAHDDLAIALALTLDLTEGQVGVPVMPEMRACNEISKGNARALRDCFLFGGSGVLVGSGCYTCIARNAAEQQHAAWRTRQIDAAATDEDRMQAEQSDVRVFTRQMLKPNTYVAARRMERAVQRLEGYW